MDTLTVDGKRIRIHRQGTGDPLLYFHSGNGELGDIPLFAALEAAGFGITAPELPGFGASDRATDWHSIEDVVFYLRRLLDMLDIDRPVLVGSSLGGWLAAEVAVWMPDRLSSLVLIDAGGLRVPGAPAFDMFLADPDESQRRANPHGHDIMPSVVPAIVGEVDQDAIQLHYIRGSAVVANIAWRPFLHDPKLLARLPLITVPTLVLWGSDDGLIPRAHGEAYAAGIPSAELRIVDQTGHTPALERPDVVAAEVAAFRATTRTVVA
jgi:pimeloyl-ACP methyl ester carboxylesterase